MSAYGTIGAGTATGFFQGGLPGAALGAYAGWQQNNAMGPMEDEADQEQIRAALVREAAKQQMQNALRDELARAMWSERQAGTQGDTINQRERGSFEQMLRLTPQDQTAYLAAIQAQRQGAAVAAGQPALAAGAQGMPTSGAESGYAGALQARAAMRAAQGLQPGSLNAAMGQARQLFVAPQNQYDIENRATQQRLGAYQGMGQLQGLSDQNIMAQASANYQNAMQGATVNQGAYRNAGAGNMMNAGFAQVGSQLMGSLAGGQSLHAGGTSGFGSLGGSSTGLGGIAAQAFGGGG